MTPKLIFFTGAPSEASLDWDDKILLNTFDGPFARFLGRQAEVIDITASALPSALPPTWRSLTLTRQAFSTAFNDSDNTSFRTLDHDSRFNDSWLFPAMSPQSYSSLVLSQFYEHSYAIHEDVPPSMLTTSLHLNSLASSDASLFATDLHDGSVHQSLTTPKPIPHIGRISDLIELPQAAYLRSIEPQTMTVNLIVGVITILPPKRIKTLRGIDIDLVEIFVGDNSKSGFSISFWLPLQNADGDYRSTLQSLRPQDIVLMGNIALSSFRGKVYGQSLRKGSTKILLLYRKKVDKNDLGGHFSSADLQLSENSNHLASKVSSVRDWVLKFVGVSAANRLKDHGPQLADPRLEVLPPDTQ